MGGWWIVVLLNSDWKRAYGCSLQWGKVVDHTHRYLLGGSNLCYDVQYSPTPFGAEPVWPLLELAVVEE